MKVSFPRNVFTFHFVFFPLKSLDTLKGIEPGNYGYGCTWWSEITLAFFKQNTIYHFSHFRRTNAEHKLKITILFRKIIYASERLLCAVLCIRLEVRCVNNGISILVLEKGLIIFLSVYILHFLWYFKNWFDILKFDAKHFFSTFLMMENRVVCQKSTLLIYNF